MAKEIYSEDTNRTMDAKILNLNIILLITMHYIN